MVDFVRPFPSVATVGVLGRRGSARAVVTTVAAAALILPGAAASAAGEPLPTVNWVPSAVLLSPGEDSATASVIGTYRCKKGSPKTDIYVSVTQGVGTGGVDGVGSPHAPAVYDRGKRTTEEPGGLPSVCDGKPHLRTMPVASRVGNLKPGTAYVHWCLSDTKPYELNSAGLAFNCNVRSVTAR